MIPKSAFVHIGDFFFKYRNIVFPFLWATLFLTFSPAPGFVTPLVGIALILVALGLFVRGAVIGYAYIKRGGLNKQVYADTLVTEGFFNTCRNPLYVGNMLIYIGVFFMHGNPTVMVIGILGSYSIYASIIAAEEYFLRQKFGIAYTTYCENVPRWYLQLSRLNEATNGMRFNFKRVWMKDYSTIANALVTLIFINALRHYHYDMPMEQTPNLALHAAVIAGIMLIAIGISSAKKSKLIIL